MAQTYSVRLLHILLLFPLWMDAQVVQYHVDDLTLEVYLPPKYDSTQKYKVVYSNDGEALFGKLSWNLDHLLDGWIKSKKIEPIILVAIFNNGSREAKFLPYADPSIGNYKPMAEEYTKQLISEVIPFVEATYSTSTERALMGASFGGLHSTWAGLKHPEVFSFIIAQSPSYWVDDFRIHEEAVRDPSQKIWIDIGTEDWDDVLSMFYHLSQKGLRPGDNLFYYEDFKGVHAGVSWKKRLLFPLILFSNGGESEVVDLKLRKEYIPSAQKKGQYFCRINPVVTLKNGFKHTSFPFHFDSEEGNIEVSPYGSFKIKPETNDNVLAEYLGKKASIKVSWKDHPLNE